MKISIVTISYNQAPFLRQCIESVLSQTEVEVEYIVVDPGSTDGSRAIIESYGNRIIRVFELDAGPADGLNHGFSRATGDIFGFINADDYFLPDALKTILRHFEMEGLDEFISGFGYAERDGGNREPIMPTRMSITNLLYGACTIFQQSTFFSSKLLQSVDGFNAANKTCWDLELFLCFLQNGFSHKVINTPLAVFRLHDASITASISGSGRFRVPYYRDLDRIFFEHKKRSRNFIDRIISYFMRANKRLKKCVFDYVSTWAC